MTSHQRNMSPSQRVFYIPELLAHIVDALAYHKPSLARMARVHSESHVPCIKCLWRNCGEAGFRHLVNLLPHSSISQQHCLSNSAASKAAWARFRSYSIHVQTLYITDAYFYSPDLYSALGNQHPTLFPRLQSLTLPIELVSRQPSTSWMKIMGRSLQKLHIYSEDDEFSLDEDNVAAHTFLQEISNHATLIKDLALPPASQEYPWDSPSPSLTQIQSSLISALTQLTHISIMWDSGVPPAILNAIGAHPVISDITLDMLEVPPHPPNVGVNFISLEVLELHGTTESVNAWFGHIKNPERLRKFHSTFLHDLSPVPISVLPSALNITSVSLKFPDIDVPLQWGQISPILACQHINTFFLQVDTFLEGMDDAELTRLAHSWKELSELTIDELGAYAYSYRPSVALVTLGTLASACPKLAILCLNVSTCVEDWSETSHALLEEVEKGSYKSLGTVTLLDFFATSLEEAADPYPLAQARFLTPERVARILRKIWRSIRSSNIQELWNMEQASSLDAKRWRDVYEFMNHMAMELN